MARASAENLRDALPDVTVPTLLVYGDQDVRALLSVAEDLHRSIPGSTLAVLPDAGHVCNLEASEAFNQTARSFLDNQPREG
jgi:pimeloyl-ACP methyl ester carboxylesterase